MKRLRRWLFNFAAVVSLLLCVATVAVWILSYYRTQGRFLGKHGHEQSSIESSRGALRFLHVSTPLIHPSVEQPPRWYSIPAFDHDRMHSRSWEWSFAGFAWVEGDYRIGMSIGDSRIDPPYPYRLILIPYWPLAVIATCLPAIWIGRFWTRKQWKGRGLCPVCGYDLRATPGRCPECGTMAGKPN